MNELEERLAVIRTNIDEAARRSGRTTADVRLVAASKRQSATDVQRLADLGVADFAESQMQEALDKIPQVDRPGLCWHFIGHLQSNKTRYIPDFFDWVHSVDSLRLARRIATAAAGRERPVKLLLQVNVARDPAKHGVLPEALFPLIDAILAAELDAISLHGLMTIGLRGVDADETRAGFAALRRLLEDARLRFGDTFKELSMGMSGDYAAAIEEGASMVRVGSALFGERG